MRAAIFADVNAEERDPNEIASPAHPQPANHKFKFLAWRVGSAIRKTKERGLADCHITLSLGASRHQMSVKTGPKSSFGWHQRLLFLRIYTFS